LGSNDLPEAPGKDPQKIVTFTCAMGELSTITSSAAPPVAREDFSSQALILVVAFSATVRAPVALMANSRNFGERAVPAAWRQVSG
jgi:hypothetical protein